MKAVAKAIEAALALASFIFANAFLFSIGSAAAPRRTIGRACV